MASDDWRVRVELEETDAHDSFLERLRHGLGIEARGLAEALTGEHLAVSRDGNELFVYAATATQATDAVKVIEAELREHGLEATVSGVECWLEAEGRWDNEPHGQTWEEELLARGYAPWEVRVACASRQAAVELAERLEGEGYEPLRRWRYLIVGTGTREEADELAARLRGEVEPGGALVWEEAVESHVVRPFVFFG